MKERLFAESAALGAEFVRVDVQLNDVFEADRGRSRARRPDWRGLDQVIALARRHRVKVLGILLNPPSWLSSVPERFPHHVRCPATDPVGVRRGSRARCAAHAGAAVDHWEILNEPDGAGPSRARRRSTRACSWLPRGDQGARARGPDRARRHHAPARACVARARARRCRARRGFDIANVHLRGSVAGWSTAMSRCARAWPERGFTGPLWVTEHGYAADPAFQSDPAYRERRRPRRRAT